MIWLCLSRRIADAILRRADSQRSCCLDPGWTDPDWTDFGWTHFCYFDALFWTWSSSNDDSFGSDDLWCLWTFELKLLLLARFRSLEFVVMLLLEVIVFKHIHITLLRTIIVHAVLHLFLLWVLVMFITPFLWVSSDQKINTQMISLMLLNVKLLNIAALYIL